MPLTRFCTASWSAQGVLARLTSLNELREVALNWQSACFDKY
jgi:hypothetical protein